MFIGKIYDKTKSIKTTEDNLEDGADKRESECESKKKDSSKVRKKTFKRKTSVYSTSEAVDINKTEKTKAVRDNNNDKSFVERLNEKVRSLKKENNQNNNQKTVPGGVYSIPLQYSDVERGVTHHNVNSRDDIEEKVKSFKKGNNKNKNKGTVSGVYSIPLQNSDVERGVTCHNVNGNFENVDLNSEEDIKEFYESDTERTQNLNDSSNKRRIDQKSVGVQASPYPPFRLHVLPLADWRESETLCLKLMKLVVCQCGLACIVFVWALFGALMFHLTEAPHEYWHAQELTKQQTSLVVGLATDLRQVVPQEPVWRTTIEKYAAEHEALILTAVSSGYPQIGTIWTYPGCLLFATSLLTTLGFGAPVPRTIVGRVSAIIFAGLGIPIHLLLILNVGLLCAVKLHQCARVSQRKFVRLRARIRTLKSGQKSDWPEEIFTRDPEGPPPPWIKFFPFLAIAVYYLTGLTLFGIARGKPFPHMFLFPLDFTLAGGVASTYGLIRIAYAVYLEGAVILASTNVALLRVCATRGFTSLALKHGLMTNSYK